MRKTGKYDNVGSTKNYLKKSRIGGVINGIDGYTYLNHIIELWPGNWSDSLG